MGVSEDFASLLLLILLVVAGLFFPLTIWVADKIGKKKTFVIAMLWFALATPLFILVKLDPGNEPENFRLCPVFHSGAAGLRGAGAPAAHDLGCH